MDMYYKLHEKAALRGWTGQPYAIQDLSTGKAAFIREEVFRALSFCNGVMDCDSFLITEKQRRIMAHFEKRGIITACNEGEHNAPRQAYVQYPCKYIGIAHWSITGKCNMLCRHCYMSAPQAKLGELSHEKCLHIIEQLKQAGITAVNLTGGEPLVRNDFLDLVKALMEANIQIKQIYTNGMLVNQKLLDDLKDLGTHPEFSLSFDGIGWHDWLRGIDGAEEIAIKAIRLLVENGYSVSIESAFHRDSIHTIIETMHLLAELGVSHWKTNPAGNSGNWLEQDRNLDLTLDELYDAYLKTIEAYYKAGSPITMMLGGFFRCAKGKQEYIIPCKKRNCEENPICLSARNVMYISPEAKLLPCIPLAGTPLQDKMPSIVDVPLVEALSDSFYLHCIETPVSALLAHQEECGVCEHRSYCGGGCRAAALMENNGDDYLGIDPATCFFFKNGYEERISQTVLAARGN
jgi:radical SAM protein with 4Fe4S-binding SPASM domain